MIQQQVGFGQVIAHIAADCAADSACNSKYPDLEVRFRSRLADLNRSPLYVEIFNPASRSRQSYPLIGVDIVDVLFDLMYGSEVLRYMPTLLDGLSRGNEASLQSWFQAYRLRTAGPDTTSEGAYYAFACAEQVAHVDMREAAAAAAQFSVYNDDGVVGFSDYLICPRWPMPAVDESELHAVISDKPVLLLSGEYDPVYIGGVRRHGGSDTVPCLSLRAAQSRPCAAVALPLRQRDRGSLPGRSDAAAAGNMPG